MNLLAMGLGADVDCVELFDLHASAKNELHICKGYSPNQWAFGKAKHRIESFLQHGDHLAVQSGRGEPTFEETLQRRNEARVVFQTPHARALNARARKSQTFNTGIWFISFAGVGDMVIGMRACGMGQLEWFVLRKPAPKNAMLLLDQSPGLRMEPPC